MSQMDSEYGRGGSVGPSPGSDADRFDLLMARSFAHLEYFTHRFEVAAQGGGPGGVHTRGGDTLESIVAPLATLMLLSWLEHGDCSTESIGRSESTGHQPLLSPEHRWSAWSHRSGKELTGFFDRDLAPALERAPTVGYGSTLRPIASVLRMHNAIPGDVWEKLVRWVASFEMKSATARDAARETVAHVARMTVRMDASTTSPLAALMVEILDPEPGGSIYDPCFGTGGLLSHAVRRSRSGLERLADGHDSSTPVGRVLGVEINPQAYVVGAAQTALAGASPLRLELRDALASRPAGTELHVGADYIVAHPPWGRTGQDTHQPLPVATKDVGMRFLQHVMASLSPAGRAVVALPDNVLYRLGADREIRRRLLSEYSVEGVVAVPSLRSRPDVIPYSTAGVNLLVFRRSAPRSTARFLSVPRELRRSPHGIAVKFREGQPDGHMWDATLDDLEKRDWDLCAKRTGSAALARKLDRLGRSDTMIETKLLGSVADITMGTPSKADAESPRIGHVVRVLRRADITDFGVRRMECGIWPPGKAPRDTRPVREASYPLCRGDVLLTVSGSIGRVVVVEELEFTSVAGHGIAAIRPSDALSPAFLKCVLASDAYQNWLRGHSRGLIQRLSASKLHELPVPVPPMELQERAVRLVAGERGDPLAAIVRVLTNTDEPVVKWLEESAEVRELDGLDGTADGTALLERIADSLRVLNEEVGSRTPTVPGLASWLNKVTKPVGALEGLTDVPPGPERLAVLDGLSVQLERISPPGDQPSPAMELAHEVTRHIARLATIERERILAEVGVEADIEPSWVAADAGNVVHLRLTNRSLLPLRKFEAFTFPKVGGARTAYLAAGATLNVPIRIPSDASVGSYRFTVLWRATLLDGDQGKGSIPLVVDVRASRPAARVREIGTSPYIVGNPIDRKEMLFGREETLAEIGRQLRSDTGANVVLLEGNRRTGKTSILKRLQDPEVLPDWVVVNCSLQGGEGHASRAGLPTNEVFRLIARDLGLAAYAVGVRVWLPNMDPPDPEKPFRVAFVKTLRRAFSGERPFETFELFLQSVIKAARPRRVLLMLDEFDKLQEGIDARTTSPQVPENIRYLLHTYPELSAVLAGSRRIKRLREEYWSALFGFGHRVPVSALPLEDARLLVTRPVDGRLVYVPEARDRVVELCARQPFLIQSLCNRLFESAARSRRRTVTVDDVETGAGVMAEDNEHFRTLWGYAGTERRRFVLALCADLGDRTPATLNLIERRLGSDGVHLRRGERLGDDLEFLREIELLALQGTRGGSAYRLAIPLMAAWVRRNVDFEDQRRRAVEEFEEADRGEGFQIAEEDEG